MELVYDLRSRAISFLTVSVKWQGRSIISNNFGMLIIGQTQDLVKLKQAK